MPGEPLIELKNVTVRHGTQTILNDMSLTVHEGEIIGLVFTHGTGKSTLLRAAAGFFRPDEGQIFYRGRDVATFDFDEEARFQAKTGFVFQNGGLLVNTNVYDNVALPLRYHTDLDEAEIEGTVQGMLGLVGMADAGDRFPFELTIVKQKLVALARALVVHPEIVFYDNFFKGTETAAWQTLTTLVRQLRTTMDLAWMLVLESDPDTYHIADRLCVIENGRVLEMSAPDTLKKSKDARVSRVFQAIDFRNLESG